MKQAHEQAEREVAAFKAQLDSQLQAMTQQVTRGSRLAVRPCDAPSAETHSSAWPLMRRA